MEIVSDLVTTASTIATFTPSFDPQLASLFVTHAENTTIELLVESEALDSTEPAACGGPPLKQLFEMIDIHTTDDQVPFGLLVAGEPITETCIVVYKNGQICGTMHATTRDAYEWARRLYRTYRQPAMASDAVLNGSPSQSDTHDG